MESGDPNQLEINFNCYLPSNNLGEPILLDWIYKYFAPVAENSRSTSYKDLIIALWYAQDSEKGFNAFFFNGNVYSYSYSEKDKKEYPVILSIEEQKKLYLYTSWTVKDNKNSVVISEYTLPDNFKLDSNSNIIGSPRISEFFKYRIREENIKTFKEKAV